MRNNRQANLCRLGRRVTSMPPQTLGILGLFSGFPDAAVEVR